VALAGCTAAGTSPSVSGTTLKIYVSVPPGGAGSEPAADVLAAEQLAFRQAAGGNTVGSFTIKLASVAGKKISDNARSAIEDSKAIAYVGEVQPGASADSVGITNAQDLLQVSGTDTAVELTRSTPTDPGSPGRYYEALGTYGRTFARVAPTTAQEATALVTEMKSLAVGAVYVASDGSTYGKAIAHEVAQDATGQSIKVTQGAPNARSFLGSGSDAIFLGSSQAGSSSAASVFSAIAETSTAKLFASSALYEPGFVAALSPAAQRRLYVSSPGFTAADLPASGKQFASAFRAAYGRTPVPEAVFGYEAVAAIMQVLHRAGSSANSRSTIVHGFFAIKNRASVLGTYSIGVGGDARIAGGAPFVIGRVKSGALVPFRAVQTRG
jgi:branched-chain amino acid transport system substrate-binding protein